MTITRMKDGLITIENHKKKIRTKRYNQRFPISGIACPKCNNELRYKKLINKKVAVVFCNKCKYRAKISI